MNKTIMALAIIALALAGCRQQKELIYFNGLQDAEIQNNTSQDDRAYKIRKNDILYIRVLSFNPEITALFNAASGLTGAQSQVQYQEAGMYYNGISVNERGMVEIPEIGEVEVVGKTIEEAREEIRTRAKVILKGATIIVKLANLKFTLLGEVKAPGIYLNYNNQTTILEALGLAGDITDYGNRKQVLVIRPTGEGMTTHRLNLNDKNLLSSPYYYVKPNDVIYVQPLKAKATRMFAQDSGVFISLLSTTVATASIILTLVLNVKK